jgi:hypothetical protein
MRNILRRTAHHVDDAQLDAGVRIYGPHRLGKAGNPVHACDEYVFNAPVSQVGQHSHPKFSPFVFLYPKPFGL